MKKTQIPSRVYSFFALFILALFLPSCGQRERARELIIWTTHNEAEYKFFKMICKEWSEKNNFPVKAKRIPFGGHEAKIRTSLTIHASPDIARVDCGFVQELARFNAAQEINNLGFDELLPHLNKAGLESNQVGDRYYGVPDQITCLALFYNKKILKNRSVELPEKMNLDQFVTILKKVTDREQGIYGLALEKSAWFHLPFFYTFGSDLTNSKSTEFTLDNPAGVSALTFMRELYHTHKVEAGSWQAGCISPEVGFLNNKYAFILSGPWNLNRFSSNKKLDYGVTMIPYGADGAATNIGGTNMVIFKKSPFKKEAASFLKYFLSKEVQVRWANELSQIPVNSEANSLVNFDEQPLLKVFLEQIKFARARPRILHFGKLCEALEPEIEAAMKGDKTPKEALQSARKTVENGQILEK